MSGQNPIPTEYNETANGRLESRDIHGPAPLKCKRAKLNAVDTAGGVFAVNIGKRCVVEAVALDVRGASSGACTVDVGVAANGTTLNDTLIDGVSVAAAGYKSTKTAPGTNGLPDRLVTAAQYVTGSVASGASAGIVGEAYIYYRELLSA